MSKFPKFVCSLSAHCSEKGNVNILSKTHTYTHTGSKPDMMAGVFTELPVTVMCMKAVKREREREREREGGIQKSLWHICEDVWLHTVFSRVAKQVAAT